jgi:hypothetical protein
LLQNKDWVAFSPIGRTANLMHLLVTLNTQDTSTAWVLRCRGNMVFLKDSTSYKKHDRYKKTLKEKIEEVNMLFENRFTTFI